jgi:hypothetical protein
LKDIGVTKRRSSRWKSITAVLPRERLPVVLSSGGREQIVATGKKPASEAGQELRNPRSTRKQRSVAGSDLAQAPKKPAKAGAKPPKRPAKKK